MTEIAGMKLEKGTLSQRIATRMQDVILQGELKPGERVHEEYWANIFGVSRAPIREACRHLESSGLVEIRSHRGAFVTEVTPERAAELIELWAELDAYAVRKCTRTWKASWKTECLELLGQLGQAASNTDVSRYAELNLAFHQLFVDWSGNQALKEVYDGIIRQIMLFRRERFHLSGGMSQSLEEHHAILNAVSEGKAEKAAEEARNHALSALKALGAGEENS